LIQFSPSQTRLLSAAPVGRLATADARGAPHVIPVCYVFDGQFIYSVLDQKPKRAELPRLKRVRNIQANPQVALVVDHYEADWQRLWYVLLTGRAELLVAGDERVEAIRLLRQKYPQYRDMPIDPNPVIKIAPDQVVSWGAGA
jgi:PPOX class probable F420-dependent enzyme